MTENLNYDPNEPDVRKVGTIVGLITISLILIFISSIYLYKSMLKDEMVRKEVLVKSFERQKLESYELNYLKSWERLSNGKVKVPIEKSKHLIIKDYRKSK